MDPALDELLRPGVGEASDEVEAIIRLDAANAEIPGVRIVSRFGPIATCRLTRDSIEATRNSPHVLSLKASRVIAPGDQSDVGESSLSLTPVSSDTRRLASLPLTGANVVVGVVDWGCDFNHPDFKSPDGSSRIIGLWDQRGLSARGAAAHYGYGTAYDQDQLSIALGESDPYRSLGYYPSDADNRDSGAHGTHVMGIAAGNGRGGGPAGVAPNADLAFVHLSNRSAGWLTNLGDSVRILEAVDYIFRTAGDRPCVINLSVGRHGGPHDGCTLVEMALDHVLSKSPGSSGSPGRFIVQSAGNYRSKCIHASGRLSTGEEKTLDIEVDPADLTPNELEIWYAGADNIEVKTISPTGTESAWTGLGKNRPLMKTAKP